MFMDPNLLSSYDALQRLELSHEICNQERIGNAGRHLHRLRDPPVVNEMVCHLKGPTGLIRSEASEGRE